MGAKRKVTQPPPSVSRRLRTLALWLLIVVFGVVLWCLVVSAVILLT